MLRRETNIKTVLKFLRDETWSNGSILATVLSLSKTGIYKTLGHMEKSGFICAYHISDLNKKIYGITSQGLLYAWDEDEQMQIRACFEPSKVKPLMIQHHLDIQIARLNAQKKAWQNWIPGHLLPKNIAKRPDAIVKDPTGKMIAIEIERTVKTRKRYEAIFAIYLQAIKRGEYESIHYVCPDLTFATRLERLFNLIDAVPIAGQRVSIGDKHRAKFPVYPLNQWPKAVETFEK